MFMASMFSHQGHGEGFIKMFVSLTRGSARFGGQCARWR